MNRSSSSSSLAAATRTMVSEAPLLELPKRIKGEKGKRFGKKRPRWCASCEGLDECSVAQKSVA